MSEQKEGYCSALKSGGGDRDDGYNCSLMRSLVKSPLFRSTSELCPLYLQIQSPETAQTCTLNLELFFWGTTRAVTPVNLFSLPQIQVFVDIFHMLMIPSLSLYPYRLILFFLYFLLLYGHFNKALEKEDRQIHMLSHYLISEVHSMYFSQKPILRIDVLTIVSSNFVSRNLEGKSQYIKIYCSDHFIYFFLLC